ncbi:MAG: ABC transporter ATP-binding protein [Alphaproteobacteria bacterium]|nr:ABC transporter ATP-binding protein [Alphaproteobacteria bacterium]
MSSGILQLQNIGMKFQSGDFFIEVLKDVNFSIHVGESVALLGQSGSGKSTLLQIAALLEQPTSGSVIMSGVNIQDTSEEKRTKLRRENLGFVYQFHNLLPEFSALENVMIPQLICGVKRKDAEQKAKNLLEQVELSHRLDKTPKTLSGGEQQRVAIARALANSPNLIIADEPTGNLDPQNAEIIFNLLLEIVQKNKTSVLLATHNVELAKKLSRTILLNNGTLSSLN